MDKIFPTITGSPIPQPMWNQFCLAKFMERIGY